MSIRSIAVAAAAATGGVLAAGFLSTAVAFAAPEPGALDPDPGFTTPGADAFTIPTMTTGTSGYTFDPFTGGSTTAPGTEGFSTIVYGDGVPKDFETGNVNQDFDVFQSITPTGGTATNTDIGDITTNENVTNLFGINSTGFYVTGGTLDTTGTGTLPGVGSTFDVTNYGGGYINYYSDVLEGSGSTATSTVKDIIDTPFGNYDISSYVSPFMASLLDPAAALPSTAADTAASVDPLAFLGL